MIHSTSLRKVFLLVFFILISTHSHAQIQPEQPKEKSEFWKRVRFGGGVGLSFGNRVTNVSLAPGMLYSVTDKVGLGVGLQGSYLKVKEQYDSWIYGGSVLALYNPIRWIQFSAELEQLRVNTEYQLINNTTFEDDFWNTALFLGAGYRMGGTTIGIRYNVLFNDADRVYAEAFMPFVRVYF